MSLLLEALKKAERDKLGLDPAQRDVTGQSAAFSQSASLSEAAAEETLPGYSVYPAASSASLNGKQKSAGEPTPEPTHERAAAQNMFAAKQGGIGGAGGRHVGKWLMVAGVALIVIVGGAYYVWQEITRAPGIGQLQMTGVPRTASIASLPAPATPAITPIAPIAKEAPSVQSSAKEAAATGVLPREERDAGGEAATKFPARVRAASPPAEPAIRIQRKQSANEVPLLLAAAYQAYLAGDLIAARQQYLQQLRIDPLNKDALLGLAAIAVHRQQPGEAQAYYLRILELDPRDPSAIAGMTGLGRKMESGQTESRLKILLAQQPDAAALHFALGNHYADQSRWGEAQQAFFRALSIDSTNADYAFNLAVSLDHLNQNKLAVEYYSKALALTGVMPAGFDKAQAAVRVKELAR